MARKHYSEDEVLRALKKKKDVRVSGYTVAVLTNKVYDPHKDKTVVNPQKVFDLGNGSWGKIDFLCKHHNYSVWYTDKF